VPQKVLSGNQGVTHRLQFTEFICSQLAAAKVWTNWEMEASHLVSNEESLKRSENEEFSLVHHFSPLRLCTWLLVRALAMSNTLSLLDTQTLEWLRL
jgi:hypothetical protein